MTSWLTLRKLVYRRDQGRCQVCLLRVGKIWDAGHLVDRIAGGGDDLDNLVLMCARCNRTEKPITPTLDAALAWLKRRRRQARTGRDIEQDWRPMWAALSGR